MSESLNFVISHFADVRCCFSLSVSILCECVGEREEGEHQIWNSNKTNGIGGAIENDDDEWAMCGNEKSSNGKRAII